MDAMLEVLKAQSLAIAKQNQDMTDLKQIVQTYVEKVVVFAEKIEIHLIINKPQSRR